MSKKDSDSRYIQSPIVNQSAFNTDGFVFPTHRIEFDDKTGNIQYPQNSLRDVIEKDLLSASVIWLLGYDAEDYKKTGSIADLVKNAPIRSQLRSSHWDTAWCLIQFIDAYPILSADHPSVVQEIDRRLSSEDVRVNPLLWLLSEAESCEGNDVRWYGKEYDTATVVLSLLRVKFDQSMRSLQEFKKKHGTVIDETLTGAFNYLLKHLVYAARTGQIDSEAPTVLSPLIKLMGQGKVTTAKILPNLIDGPGLEQFYYTLDQWLSYLGEPGDVEQVNSADELALDTDSASTLCGLVLTWNALQGNERKAIEPFARRAQSLLLKYVKYLETSLSIDQWGENLNRIWRLGVYVDACRAITVDFRQENSLDLSLSKDGSSPEIVLKVLSMIKNEFFSNGSIYHSVYTTVYFARTLISVWHWPTADKDIAVLYHYLLDRFVIRGSVERKENFEIRRLLIESNHELAVQQKKYEGLVLRERKKRYALLVFLWISLSPVIILSLSMIYSFSQSDIIALTGTVVAVLAIIIVLIEQFLLKEN